MRDHDETPALLRRTKKRGSVDRYPHRSGNGGAPVSHLELDLFAADDLFYSVPQSNGVFRSGRNYTARDLRIRFPKPVLAVQRACPVSELAPRPVHKNDRAFF